MSNAITLPEPDGSAEANQRPHPGGGYEYDEVPAWSEPLVHAHAAAVLAAERITAAHWQSLAEANMALAVSANKRMAAKDAEIAGLRADNTRLQNEVVMPLRDRIKVLEDALRAADAAFEAVEIFMPDGCKEEFAFYADWEDVRSALGDKMPNV